MVPTLVTIRNGVVDSVHICKDGKHLEKKFKEQALLEGIRVTEEHVDNGYVETEVGSICMSWAETAQ
jgi:hypothetical protein